jgi:hypothetical protein
LIEERQTLLAPAEVTPLLATLRPDAIEKTKKKKE